VNEQIAENLAQVRARIAAAAARADRDPEEVTLVAVTKTRTPEEVASAYQAGVRHIGENRVEEAEAKRSKLDLPGATWHMVGHVQSRKAERAAACFDVVHSVDRVKIARYLDRAVEGRESPLPVLIEVNVGGEASKYGFGLEEREALDRAITEILSLAHLQVEGLMTVAPIAEDPEDVRPVFARLRVLRDALRERFPVSAWNHLSMGMTDDFEVAVEEGATMVRIGRAIFGPRR
jgi:pyridoxal phosphate enzyme (YggS family)